MTNEQWAVTFADIQAAAERLGGLIRRTPVLPTSGLPDCDAVSVLLKCENLQWGSAFKARGATNAVMSLSAEQAACGVVTHSSGNHAAALARAALQRGIAAHIVMPRNSAAVKLQAVRQLGIEPILCESTAAAREAAAAEVQQRTGAVLVHPFNDPRVIAGQGTAAAGDTGAVSGVAGRDCAGGWRWSAGGDTAGDPGPASRGASLWGRAGVGG